MKTKLLLIFTLTCSLFLICGLITESAVRSNTTYHCNDDQVTHLLKRINKDKGTILIAVSYQDLLVYSKTSINKVIDQGVDIVEIEIKLNKDSVLVLTPSKENGPVYKHGKIFDLKTNSAENDIQTLEECMLGIDGNILVCINNYNGDLDIVERILNKTGTINQVIIKVQEDIDHVSDRYGTVLDRIKCVPVVNAKTPYVKGFVDDFLIEFNPYAFEVSFNLEDSLKLDIISMVKERGCNLWVESLYHNMNSQNNNGRNINDIMKDWDWLIEQGANIIQTDRPELLLEYLREKGLHD
ncbi:hypothetical protein E9993_22310 [Labilibacter sediminis]|nr:hypothetical protein E9993_22310 [Labilibacter sediminis]